MAESYEFASQRKQVLDAYKAANQAFTASTKPYKSTGEFNFAVVNHQAAGNLAFAVAPEQQKVEWFGYGLGGVVSGTGTALGIGLVAREDDTNVSKARSTNGAEDFVIEGMSASARNYRALFSAADIGSLDQVAPGGPPTAEVLAALTGQQPIVDPAAAIVPPQVGSPFNLEQVLMEAIAPHIAIEFEWDRSRVEKVGTLDQIPEGGAKSFLHAHGDPATANRYRIPEGYLWRRDGQPDSEFIVRGTLVRPVVIPIFGTSFGANVPSNFRVPLALSLAIVVRLHGLSVKLPSRN